MFAKLQDKIKNNGAGWLHRTWFQFYMSQPGSDYLLLYTQFYKTMQAGGGFMSGDVTFSSHWVFGELKMNIS